MIVSRTPYRISFFGGGTDYPVWFRDHGGAALSCSINRFCYLSVRRLPPFFDYRSRIVWSSIELVDRIAEIKHPAVRGVLSFLGMDDGVEIHHSGDLPARTGIGSSSAFTVGLLRALHALRQSEVSAEQLARQAIHVEQNVLAENVGVQDQIAVAHGGLNELAFHPDGSYEVTPLDVPAETIRALESHMLLLYTGISRHSSEIAGETIRNIPARQTQLRAMQAMVAEGRGLLLAGDMAGFGRLLDEAWRLKQSLSPLIGPDFIAEAYAAAIEAGALGGKVLGAGGGGFLLIFVAPERRAAVRAALPDMLEIPVGLEFEGSRIVVGR